MAECKKIAEISYVIDTETNQYQMGEVCGGFDEKELEKYITNYGHKKLCTHLAYLQFQVWEKLRELNAREDNNQKPNNNLNN